MINIILIICNLSIKFYEIVFTVTFGIGSIGTESVWFSELSSDVKIKYKIIQTIIKAVTENKIAKPAAALFASSDRLENPANVMRIMMKIVPAKVAIRASKGDLIVRKRQKDPSKTKSKEFSKKFAADHTEIGLKATF